MPLRFWLGRFFRFAEGVVKKEAKPPATDFGAGLEISEYEESDDDDDFRLLDFLGERVLRLDLYIAEAAEPTAAPKAASLRAECRPFRDEDLERDLD